MENPIAGLMIVVAVLATTAAPAAPVDLETFQERIETAYHHRALEDIEQARQELLQFQGPAADADQLAYLDAYALFRQALLVEDDAGRARVYLDACITDLEDLVRRQPARAEALALLGSCYGISTRYYPLALASRGLKARAHLTAARALAPENPWVMLQDGLADDATPALFGGSTGRAIGKVAMAADRFGESARTGSRVAAWAAVEAWLQLARMYRETGRVAESEEALVRARQAEPDIARLLASSRPLR